MSLARLLFILRINFMSRTSFSARISHKTPHCQRVPTMSGPRTVAPPRVRPISSRSPSSILRCGLSFQLLRHHSFPSFASLTQRSPVAPPCWGERKKKNKKVPPRVNLSLTHIPSFPHRSSTQTAPRSFTARPRQSPAVNAIPR